MSQLYYQSDMSFCDFKEIMTFKKRDLKQSVFAFLSGRQDSNLRPPGPKPGALPGCATPRLQELRKDILVLRLQK